jgi:hypothetical protein
VLELSCTNAPQIKVLESRQDSCCSCSCSCFCCNWLEQHIVFSAPSGPLLVCVHPVGLSVDACNIGYGIFMGGLGSVVGLLGLKHVCFGTRGMVAVFHVVLGSHSSLEQ